MGWHYAALEDRFKRLSDIEGASGDPRLGHGRDDAAEGGGRPAASRLATLKRLAHDLLTAAETGEQLDGGRRASRISTPGRVPICARCSGATVTPTRSTLLLVEALAKATNACEMVWREARAQSDFTKLAAPLAEVVRLVRETAEVTGAALGLSPYDALLDAQPAGPARRGRSSPCSPSWRLGCRRWSTRPLATPGPGPGTVRKVRSRPSARKRWRAR